MLGNSQWTAIKIENNENSSGNQKLEVGNLQILKTFNHLGSIFGTRNRVNRWHRVTKSMYLGR